jgi:hypothetical protein
MEWGVTAEQMGPTRANCDAEFVDDGMLHRQVFLVLRDDALVTHGPAAVRTGGRQRCLVRDVHGGGVRRCAFRPYKRKRGS